MAKKVIKKKAPLKRDMSMNYGQWEEKVKERCFKIFEELFGERDPSSNTFIVYLDLGEDPVPKDKYPHDTITKTELYKGIGYELYSPYYYDVCLNIVNDLYDRLIKNNPTGRAADVALRRRGSNAYDVLLSIMYDNINIHGNIEEVFNNSGITII